MTTEEWNDIFPSLPEDVRLEMIEKIKQMWAEIGGDEQQLLKLIKNDIGYNNQRLDELARGKDNNFDTRVS